jgi:hypothetical protein
MDGQIACKILGGLGGKLSFYKKKVKPPRKKLEKDAPQVDQHAA